MRRGSRSLSGTWRLPRPVPTSISGLVIPGIEISSQYQGSEVHILGYFLDWQDPLLHERMAQLRESRHHRNPQIVEKLRELGMDITYEEVKTLAGAGSVGRPHIARVLMDKGYVQSSKEAFTRFLADGKPAYVPREFPVPEEGVRWIKEAKGIPVLAHPLWIKVPDDQIDGFCENLKGHGLGEDGTA